MAFRQLPDGLSYQTRDKRVGAEAQSIEGVEEIGRQALTEATANGERPVNVHLHVHRPMHFGALRYGKDQSTDHFPDCG